MKHNKISKKTFINLIAFILILSVANITASAANLGTVSYWKSDSNSCGYWTQDEISKWVSISTYTGGSDWADGNSAYSSAMTQWNSVPNISFYGAGVMGTNVPLLMAGGTYDEIIAFDNDFSPILTSYAGWTKWWGTNKGTVTYNSTSKNVNEVTRAKACIIKKSGKTLNQYKSVATHEMGHALGWFGHSSNTSDIMYSIASSITTLTTADKNHLSQIWKLK